MKPIARGRDALARYLDEDWTFDQLYDWAITYWDSPEKSSDEESAAIAGHVLEWVWALGDGVSTMDEFNAEMSSLASTPREVIAPHS